LKWKIMDSAKHYPIMTVGISLHDAIDELYTIFDNVLFGLWQKDEQFADWLLNMWTYSVCTPKISYVEYSSLHLATIHENTQLIEMLLCHSNRAHINEVTATNKQTALHFSICTGNRNAQLTFFEFGANSHLKNRWGQLYHEFVNPDSPESMALSNTARKEYAAAQQLDPVEIPSCAYDSDCDTVRNEQVDNHEEKAKEIVRKTVSKGRKKIGDNTNLTTPTYTTEDIEKAKEAEKQLLEMLEAEEETTEMKNHKKKNALTQSKQKNNNNKKK
jgi:hypothetical protein